MKYLEILRVFNYWKEKTNKAKKIRMTNRRVNFIEQALKEHPIEDIILLLDYIFDSEDEYALFMRGNNERGKKYTDLGNIFRPTKLSEKIGKAKEWKSATETPEDDFGWEIK